MKAMGLLLLVLVVVLSFVLVRPGAESAEGKTGKLTNKRYGRIGDSPVIGAGTYAENGACAVSWTGHGEVFIRHAVAHDVVALMKYGKRLVQEAAEQAIRKLPKEAGGVGGVIAFDTEGMYRGTITADGKVWVTIYDK